LLCVSGQRRSISDHRLYGVRVARRVRAAVAQARAASSTPAALETVAELARQARGAEAELLVFPEAFLGGYPRGAGFGAVIGDRSQVGRDEFLAYSRQAVTIPGPEIERLCDIAREHRVHLVVGLIERAGTTLYCAAVTLDEDGVVVGRRRKVMPTGSERLVWGQGDGSTLHVVPTRVGRLATVICWENLMPMLRMSLYAQGVEVWCAPTADARDVQLATMRHIAVEGRSFVLAANQVARAKDLSPEFTTAFADPDEIVCRGASVIVDPFGEVLAGPLSDEEGLLFADLDLDQVTRGRYDFDVAGHYSRPDLFKLTVDRSVKAPLEWRSDAAEDVGDRTGSDLPGVVVLD
jgi:nitrilase